MKKRFGFNFLNQLRLQKCITFSQSLAVLGLLSLCAISTQAQTQRAFPSSNIQVQNRKESSKDPFELATKTTFTNQIQKIPDLKERVLKQDRISPKDIFKKPDLIIKPDLKRTLLEGGWGSSGGGSGIACFKDISSAQEADKYINQNLPLPQTLIDQIKNIETLDYWEWRAQKPYPLFQSSAKNSDELVYEVHKRIAKLVPLFALRLEQSGELIEMKTWEEKQQVPRIYDAAPGSPLPSHCKQVQLAVRYAKDSYDEFGVGPSKKIPVVKVELNKPLFDRLDLTNQAILILHEQTYLLGQMLGIKNSDEIRIFVMMFMDARWEKLQPVSPEQFAIKYMLVKYFGDYLNYFGDEIRFKAEPFSQESRLNSFYAVVNTIRDKIRLCDRGLLPKDEMVPWRSDLPVHRCKDFAMNPFLISKWATDEMAYIFISYYVGEISLKSINAEYLMAPFEDPDSIAFSNQALHDSCQLIQEIDPRAGMDNLQKKALNYCRNLIRHLGPMEKDRN